MPPAPRRISIEERRARLARRHRLASGHRAADVVDAARSVVCLHATDPSTVFLSAWARVDGMTVADLERALYVDRSLVKHLAMRRTLFVFPRERLADAQAGASTRVAGQERRRLTQFVETSGLQANGARWLTKVSAQVIAALADGGERTYADLRKALPLLDGSVAYGEGKTWEGVVAVGPRVLTALSAAGAIVRATNAGRWTVSRPRWSSTASWLGSTLTAVRRALVDVRAVAVDLDGATGYVLPDDVDAPAGRVAPWVALLPGLDPTVMGWNERAWYLGAHKAQVFDRNGNAGPTVWCDGRIVGGWRQRSTGEIEIQCLEDVGRERRRAIDAEAARLTQWLGGVRVQPRFPSPLCKKA